MFLLVYVTDRIFEFSKVTVVRRRCSGGNKNGEYSLHVYFQIIINNDILMFWRLELSLDYLNNGFRQLSGFCKVPGSWYSDLLESKTWRRNRQKNWTRNVICISIFQVFHPTDVEIKVSKRSLPSKRRWFCFFNLYNISRGVRGLLTITDLAMIMPLTTWNLLDFRLAQK